jgi:glycosyltransferase involved in cell wall biosynthesis
MRIGIVSPDPASSGGGVERFCHELSNALNDLGHEALVVSWPLATPSDFDVLVTNGMLGGRVRGVRRIHVAHGCWVPHVMLGSREASRRWRAKRTLEGAIAEIRAGRGAFRVAVSASAADEWRRWYRLPCDSVAPNPVDTNLFRAMDRRTARESLGWPQDQRIALFVGRAEQRKCPGVAVHAVRAAGWQLMHAGSGDIAGAVSLGSLSGRQVATAYSAADAMILPSRYEGCSLAILEALACGTPVVATRIGWMKELGQTIPGYDVLLADPDDVRGFELALRNSTQAQTAVLLASEYVRSHHDRSALRAAWAIVLQRFLNEELTPWT